MSIAVCAGMDETKTRLLTVLCPFLMLLLSMFVSFVCGLTADQGVRKELECLEMYERKEL